MLQPQSLFPSLWLISPCLTPRQNPAAPALPWEAQCWGSQQSNGAGTPCTKALPSLASTTLKKDARKGDGGKKKEEEEIHSLGLFHYWREWVKAPQKQLNKEERENKAKGEVQGRLKGRKAVQVVLSPSPSRDP